MQPGTAFRRPQSCGGWPGRTTAQFCSVLPMALCLLPKSGEQRPTTFSGWMTLQFCRVRPTASLDPPKRARQGPNRLHFPPLGRDWPSGAFWPSIWPLFVCRKKSAVSGANAADLDVGRGGYSTPTPFCVGEDDARGLLKNEQQPETPATAPPEGGVSGDKHSRWSGWFPPVGANTLSAAEGIPVAGFPRSWRIPSALTMEPMGGGNIGCDPLAGVGAGKVSPEAVIVTAGRGPVEQGTKSPTPRDSWSR